VQQALYRGVYASLVITGSLFYDDIRPHFEGPKGRKQIACHGEAAAAAVAIFFGIPLHFS